MLASTQVKIRWIEDEDPRHPEPEQVARILQRAASPDGWTASDVRKFMDCTDHIPKVIVVNGKVMGCCFYVLYKHFVMIEQLAVDPLQKNKGYEAKLLDHLKRALRQLRRRVIAIIVPETATELQLILRDNGFRWIRTLHKGTTKESYVMKFISS